MTEETNPNEASQSNAVDASQPSKLKRFVAFFLDGFGVAIIASIVVGVGMTMGPVMTALLGAVAYSAAAYYMAIRDSLNDGRSFGKKIMGLKVKTPSGSPCSAQQSIERNTIIAAAWALSALAILVSFIPIVKHIGTLLQLAGSLAVLYEALQVLVIDPNGRRLFESKSQCFTVPE